MTGLGNSEKERVVRSCSDQMINTGRIKKGHPFLIKKYSIQSLSYSFLRVPSIAPGENGT